MTVVGHPPQLLALDAGEHYRFGFSMKACIGCHSCEVACAEQNGLPEGTVWRRVGEIEGGDHPHTRRFHLSMSCNHCVEPACLEGCPTNAYELLGADHGGDRYTYVDQPGHGPVSASRAADRWLRTTCGYCSVGCGMLVGVRDGTAVAVQGDPDHPVNRGRLCPKGLSEHQMLRAPGRLTTPRVDGSPASWDVALERVVGGFKDLLDRHGPDAVAVLSTGQLVTEEFYALGKLVRLGMGLRHYDGNTTLCMASAVAGYKLSFGTDGPPGCYEDFEHADVVVLWGANIADNHPLLAPRVLARGVEQTLVVVDPRVTKSAMVADIHVPVRPRGDIALLNGVLRVLLDEGLVDVDASAAGRTPTS